MCRMSALAATALILALPSPGLAAPRTGPAPAAQAPARATPEVRAQAARLDPLARAAFWAREVEIDPGDTAAAVSLSQALRSMGRNADALAAVQTVLVAHPDDVEALLESARCQIGQGQGFFAIAPARQAARLAPRDWRPASLLGVAYEQAQRDDEALAAHRQAVALAPDNPAALTNLALFLAARGRSDEAEALLRKAAARPDAPIAVRQNLALVLGLNGRLDEAEKLVREDLPPALAANNLAYLKAAAGGAASTRSWETLKDRP